MPTPTEIIAGIMDRIVDRPGHNMLAHEVIKKLEAAGYKIIKIEHVAPQPFVFRDED